MLVLTILICLCCSNPSFSQNSGTPEYMGESFSVKYLELDRKPTFNDLMLYVNTINRTAKYFTGIANETDMNVALGSFFAGAIIKAILKDYSHKLDGKMLLWFKDILKSTQIILSHWVYYSRDYGWSDRTFHDTHQLKDDTTLVHTLSKFNTGRLKKWIFSKGQINEFVQQFDEAKVPKEKYIELVESGAYYYVSPLESDRCISRVSEMPIPTDPAGQFTRCRPDPECEELLHSSPSVAYALTHRQLNIALRYLTRRCYLTSEQQDLQHLDILCAFMFREAVYIARRGFFARDLFLEHIALCGMLGYEEMHRTSWFHKISSWVDNFGCLPEDRNFEINQTAFYMRKSQHDLKNQDRMRRRLQNKLKYPCHMHLMALSLMTSALAIRHAIHHLPSMIISQKDEL